MSFTPLPEPIRDDFIAKGIAVGRTDEELARLYNLTPTAIRGIRANPDFAARVDYYRQQNKLAVEMLTSYRDSLLPKAFRVVEDVLDTPGTDKNKVDIAKWLLDGVLPKRMQHDFDGGTLPTIDIKIVQHVGEGLDKLTQIHTAHSVEVDLESDPNLHRPTNGSGQ